MKRPEKKTSFSFRALAMAGAMAASIGVAPAFADAKSEKYVAEKANYVLSVLNDEALDDEARAAKFSEFMNTFADFRAIARRVLGPATRQMSEQQLEAYYEAFEQYAVAVYQDQLDQFRGEEIRVTGSRDLSDRNSHVGSMIKSSDTGKDVEVVWDVLESRDGSKYLVRDVALNIGGNNQFWLAVDQHQDFQAFLKRNNNDIDALIENIKQMTAAMKTN